MRSDAPEDEARRLVRGYVTAWNSHDVGRLLSLFAEDGSYGEFGLGRIMLGQEEIRRYLIATFAALPDLSITPAGEPVNSGERVFWKWLMTATHQGEFVGVPATGKRFEVRGLTALLARGGEILRAADCHDVSSFVRQVAPEHDRHLSNATRSADLDRTELDSWLTILSDEDNIGYGE
jgi:steroid delta-isomerase-like uncharacterized protein